MLRFITVACALAAAVTAYDVSRMEQKSIQWVGGPLDWPCDTTKSIFKKSGRYISKNAIVTRAVIFREDAIVALPRCVET